MSHWRKETWGNREKTFFFDLTLLNEVGHLRNEYAERIGTLEESGPNLSYECKCVIGFAFHLTYS